MSATVTDTDFWKLAERACTEKQLAVLRYRAAGFSERRTADILDVDRTTVRDHMRAADLKIRQELAAERGIE